MSRQGKLRKEVERLRFARLHRPVSLEETVAKLKALWGPDARRSQRLYFGSPFFGIFRPRKWRGAGWLNVTAQEQRISAGYPAP